MTATTNINNYLDLIKHDLNLIDLLTGTRPNHLTKEDFSDWQVTTLFYIDCIYLKAVCRLFGEDIQDHHALRQIINTRAELWNIAKAYRHLEEDSRDARYEGRKFDKAYISTRLMPKFMQVRDCAVALIKKNGIDNVPSVDPTSFLNR